MTTIHRFNCVAAIQRTDHDDNSNEEISEDEVSDEEEGNGKELTSTVAMCQELLLEISPAISLYTMIVTIMQLIMCVCCVCVCTCVSMCM